jgi:cytochrome c peroxidase
MTVRGSACALGVVSFVLSALALAVAMRASSAQSTEPIVPLPRALKLDPSKVALGDKLFRDPRFSRDNSRSCASCHVLELGGVDHLPVSVGIGGAQGAINAPTVFNSGFNFRQFWDGRASSLEEQINDPITNPKELGSSWNEVLAKLAADPALAAQFKQLYPDGLQIKNVRDVIATFERSLITPNSQFDRYLLGDKSALSVDEEHGYRLFKDYGCIACHQGVNIGGNMFQRFGVLDDYFEERGNVTRADLGRYNVTKAESDKYVFKVPGLRNVAATAPYFHDGSAKTLEDAVDVMFKYQLGRSAPRQDKALIVKFLHTLTGEYQGKRLVAQQ